MLSGSIMVVSYAVLGICLYLEVYWHEQWKLCHVKSRDIQRQREDCFYVIGVARQNFHCSCKWTLNELICRSAHASVGGRCQGNIPCIHT
jgi:hypothetical protein